MMVHYYDYYHNEPGDRSGSRTRISTRRQRRARPRALIALQKRPPFHEAFCRRGPGRLAMTRDLTLGQSSDRVSSVPS